MPDYLTTEGFCGRHPVDPIQQGEPNLTALGVAGLEVGQKAATLFRDLRVDGCPTGVVDCLLVALSSGCVVDL